MAFRKTSYRGVSCYRHHSGQLCADYRDPETGKRKRELLEYRNKAQALGWLKDKADELQAIKFKIKRTGRRTNLREGWTHIFDEYKKDFAKEHGSDAADITMRDYLAAFKDFVTKRTRQGLDLTPTHLASFRTELSRQKKRVSVKGRKFKTLDETLGPATLNRRLGAVKSFLSWARRNDYVRLTRDDVSDRLQLYKIDKRLPRALKSNELKRLIAAVVENDTAKCHASRNNKHAYHSKEPDPDAPNKNLSQMAPAVFIAMLTGARPGEVLQMKWSDVDFETGEIRVLFKTRIERVIPLRDSPALVSLLSALKLKAGEAIHVCGDNETKGPRKIRRSVWSRLRTLAGLPTFTPKDLRSTFASALAHARRGPTAYELALRMGHTLEVAQRHYVTHAKPRAGATVEEWLEVKAEVEGALRTLNLHTLKEARTSMGQASSS